MHMIPQIDYELEADFDIEEMSSSTFKLLIDKKRIIGKCDDLDAVKQAVYLMLNVERYQYVIYSENYGVELMDLIGQPIPYVLPELKRRITECLTQDDRIDSVDGFEFEVNKQFVHCTFTVHSNIGSFESESVVNV